MRICVLGARGMLGARVCEEFERVGCEVFRVTREHSDLSIRYTVESGFWSLRGNDPDWIVNCAGIVKSREAERPLEMTLVNAAMPHWLETYYPDTRILHVSTDCVFSGKDGIYDETDCPDPVDLYGCTKLAGELRGENSITVRTSFIGWEDGTHYGLLDWLTRQSGRIKGYKNATWTGLSAREVARALVRMLVSPDHKVKWSGGELFHLGGDLISKFDLLRILSGALKFDVEVEPVNEPIINRDLNVSKFCNKFVYDPPTWHEMAQELARERPT